MKTTSFGLRDEFLFEGQRVEYLEFETEGRPHRHKEVEVFKVIEGCGKLYIEGAAEDIKEGDVRSIPINKSHYMGPVIGGKLKILIFYKNLESLNN